MSLDELDPVLTPPKRLAALGAVAATRKMEFAVLRDLLDISDSDLSKQLKALVDAGYVESQKTGKGGVPSNLAIGHKVRPQGAGRPHGCAAAPRRSRRGCCPAVADIPLNSSTELSGTDHPPKSSMGVNDMRTELP